MGVDLREGGITATQGDATAECSWKYETGLYVVTNYNMAVMVPPPGGANGGNAIVIHDADGEPLACCDLEAC